MNLREALLAGPAHGTDRLSVEADRRLRRRLGLESSRAAARRAWLVPAFAACAVAAVAIVVLVQQHSSAPRHAVATGFVDVSTTRWAGAVTTDTLEVDANSPAAARVTRNDADITAAPGTRLSARTGGHLALARGAIQLERTSAAPPIVDLIVDVPQGRVVIGQ